MYSLQLHNGGPMRDSTMENPGLSEKKFSILQEITGAIATAENISAVANLMLDLAINYTEAEKGSLMLRDSRDELYILAARGFDVPLVRTYRTKIGEGVVGIVAKNRTPALVEDINRDKRFKGAERDRYRTKSFISCPIISRNRLLGVINVNDKKDGTPFSEDEFTLIKIIADQAAVALENAFLMNQLRVKAAELEETNRRLIETDVLKTENITHLSHELRTPLNSVKGAIYHLLQSGKLTPGEQREFYSIISDETEKLIGIVDNLLDFLRFEDETRIIKKTLINLPDLLKELSGSRHLGTLLSKKQLKLKTDIGEGISDIVGDRMRVVQLFINLIGGLSTYLETGDTIVMTARENDYVEVTITLPRRIPDNIMPYLFHSGYMFQSDPEERLKLYLARKVAEFHRWELNARNTNYTCKVTLTIPKSARERTEAIVTTTMELFVEFISDMLGINTCSVMLSDELTGELTIKSARGLEDSVIKQTRIRFGDRISGWVALEGKPLLIEDIEADPRFGRKNVPQYNTKSLLSVPLKIQDKVIGVLNLNNKLSAEPFTARDLDVAAAVSDRVSHFIEKLQTGEYGEADFRQFLTSFYSLIDAERRYHKKRRVLPDLMVAIMERLGASEEDRHLALYVSMIYDLGLVLVDESILKKKTKLSPSETRTLKVHPHTTVNLLKNFEFSEDVKRAVLHHHERYDGGGYPDSLSAEEIPFVSRVLSVVDAFCAMTEERPYRKTFTKEGALKEIKKASGTLYDPRVVDALEEVVASL